MLTSQEGLSFMEQSEAVSSSNVGQTQQIP